MLRDTRGRHGRRFRLYLSFHAWLIGGLWFLRCFRGAGSIWLNVVIGWHQGLRMSFIDQRLLLAYLASGFRLIFRLFFTALHALAHPVAHASVCNTSS